MRFICLPLCFFLLMLCGCEKNAQGLDEKEERNPLVKQGQSYMEIRNWDKAETAFKQALENNPKMARPHLDLAIIYQQYKPDYIKAIYHYDRYLELRPNAEKTEFIEEQKIKVDQALAQSYVKRSKDMGQMEAQLKRLQQENLGLKRQLAAQSRPAPAVAATQAESAAQNPVEETKPKAVVSSGKEAATHRIYTVLAGDTLTKIAQKFYGNSNYEPIYEANRDHMKNYDDLRIGQTLVIPSQ